MARTQAQCRQESELGAGGVAKQPEALSQGVMGLGWHTPKLPGLGDVNWGRFFSALTDTGYKGAVCIEVEDRAFEGALEDRKRALRLSKRYLEQFV